MRISWTCRKRQGKISRPLRRPLGTFGRGDTLPRKPILGGWQTKHPRKNTDEANNWTGNKDDKPISRVHSKELQHNATDLRTGANVLAIGVLVIVRDQIDRTKGEKVLNGRQIQWNSDGASPEGPVMQNQRRKGETSGDLNTSGGGPVIKGATERHFSWKKASGVSAD